jgi:hypothetical protein
LGKLEAPRVCSTHLSYEERLFTVGVEYIIISGSHQANDTLIISGYTWCKGH